MENKQKEQLKAELVAELKKIITGWKLFQEAEVGFSPEESVDCLADSLLPAWTDHKAVEALRNGKVAKVFCRWSRVPPDFEVVPCVGVNRISNDPAESILAVAEIK